MFRSFVLEMRGDISFKRLDKCSSLFIFMNITIVLKVPKSARVCAFHLGLCNKVKNGSTFIKD